LTSVQMGAGRGISLGGGTVSASDPSLSEVTISKMTDSTTPSLFVLCCGGTATVSQPINYVTIDFRKTGSSQVFYRLQLQNVYVSGASTSGGGGIPSESLSLFYTKISWSYVTFDQYSKVQSTVTKGWDVVKNAAF
jgi:type VI secretion system secreted protein Hcp